LLLSALAAAQADYHPNRSVTIICDATPGATPDVGARFIADALTKMWGKQVVVVNHPGANGSIAARAGS
jgi:tripartite-type tricarboxylate transporter receptor subunit TctC